MIRQGKDAAQRISSFISTRVGEGAEERVKAQQSKEEQLKNLKENARQQANQDVALIRSAKNRELAALKAYEEELAKAKKLGYSTKNLEAAKRNLDMARAATQDAQNRFREHAKWSNTANNLDKDDQQKVSDSKQISDAYLDEYNKLMNQEGGRGAADQHWSSKEGRKRSIKFNKK